MSLIPAGLLAGGSLTNAEKFDDVIVSSSYLPRLQVFGSSSNDVKEERIRQGMLGLVKAKEDIDELGRTIDCLPIEWRFKAMQIAEGEVLSVYDPDSSEFKRISELSEEANSGCMFGVEFLLWIPGAGFATYFLSSKSSRREAKPLRALIGQAATISVVLIKTKKYSWHAPKVSACSTPFTSEVDLDKLTKELEKFRNPKEGKASEEETPKASSRER